MYYHNAPIDTVEEEPLSLFGSLEVAPDGSVAQEAIGSRLYQIDAALHNELDVLTFVSRPRHGCQSTQTQLPDSILLHKCKTSKGPVQGNLSIQETPTSNESGASSDTSAVINNQ